MYKPLTKQQIKEKCSKGLSEDINGEFYTIYDFDKIYDMCVEKTDAWFRQHLPRIINEYFPGTQSGISYTCVLNEDIREDYRNFMNN